MSLIIAVYVPTGIVISADSRTTGTITQHVPNPLNPQQPLPVKTNIVLSDSAYKLFLLFERFGVATFGDAILNDLPIAHHVEQFREQQPAVPDSTEDCSQKLLAHFRGINANLDVLGFVVAGYDEGVPAVFSIDVRQNTIDRQNMDAAGNLQYGIARGGDRAIVDRLLSQSAFNPPFNLMNLQDAVDYSRHFIRTTIDQMRFEPRFATVGGHVDTLALSPGNARFLSRKELHA
jgi:hypothetical protein